MYRRILVATDGSKLSGKAVRHALALAKALDARVTALYVVYPPSTAIYAEGVLYDPVSKKEHAAAAARESERVLAPVGRKAAAAGVACEVLHTVSDAPWKAILDAARTAKSDVIVMASHGRRGLSALLLGSETNKVLTHAKIPVIVVR